MQLKARNFIEMFKITVLTCITILATYSVGDDIPDEIFDGLHSYTDGCIRESGANEDDVVDLYEGDVNMRREAKCILACYVKKFGVMENGTIDVNQALAITDRIYKNDANVHKKWTEAIRMCYKEMNKLEEDECELVISALDCLRANLDHKYY